MKKGRPERLHIMQFFSYDILQKGETKSTEKQVNGCEGLGEWTAVY